MKRVLLVASFCLLITTGCAVPWRKGPPQSERWPVLPEPERVVLAMPADIKAGEHPKVDKMIDALFTSIKEIEKWHDIVRTYNKRAKEHNDRVDKNLGITPAPRSDVR